MSIEHDYKIGDRVVIEHYEPTNMYIGEIGTISGFSPTGKFMFVKLDNETKYKCIDKWVKPCDVSRLPI